MDLTRRGFGLSTAAAALAASAPALGQQAEAWSEAPTLPIRVQEIYPAVLDGRIYVVGGLSPDVPGGRIGASPRAFSWAPGERHWRDIESLPLPTHHPACVPHQGALLAIGGFTGENGGLWSMSAAVRRYDPRRRRWGSGPDMPQPLAETVAVALEGNIHIVTGRRPAGFANAQWGDHADTNAHLVLEPGTSAWRVAPPASTARNSAAGAVLGGLIHIVGGRTVTGGNTPVHEAYDPRDASWRTLAPLPEPILGPCGSGGLAAATLNDQLYVFGGEWFDATGGGVYAQVWRYDRQADSWQDAGMMPTPRHGLGAVTLGEAIYTIGGAARPSGADTSNLVEVFRVPA